MATENELILQQHIGRLQCALENVTRYLSMVECHLNQPKQQSVQEYNTPFYAQQNVDVYLPFFVDQTACNVFVQEEIGVGQYRQLTPVIVYSGNLIKLSFDMPKNGLVTVTQQSLPSSSSPNIPMPPQFFVDDVALLHDTTSLPINPQTPTEKPYLCEENQFEVSDDDFARAMGAIKKWPR